MTDKLKQFGIDFLAWYKVFISKKVNIKKYIWIHAAFYAFMMLIAIYAYQWYTFTEESAQFILDASLWISGAFILVNFFFIYKMKYNTLLEMIYIIITVTIPMLFILYLQL